MAEKTNGTIQVFDVNVGILEHNDRVADEVRARLKKQKTFMVNVMASPGAGKTTLLLETIRRLKDRYRIGVMEADIEATVDAEKMQAAGVRSIQLHTGGECAMDAEMTRQALDEFPTEDLDVLFLENIGNLVCPAETDVGSSIRMEILSVPEGDDKPLKYPLMFRVCNAVVISKIDTTDYFPFDFEAAEKRIHDLRPDSRIFRLSAKTGEGVGAWVEWLADQIEAWKRSE